MNSKETSRRNFLKGTAGAVGGVTAAAVFQNLLMNPAKAGEPGAFGAPVPTNDETTGLPLLQLPPGFRYQSFGWTGDEMMDGNPTPAVHDGMAVVFARGSRMILVRNHEIRGAGPAFSSPAVFNPQAPGGTTNLAFDRFKGEWLKSWPSISGTSTNCAGGPTPWGAWLTGEETMNVLGGVAHGWVFEVPANAQAQAVPLKALGRFAHEALAVDPRTGIVYETEDDRYTSGFYRFLPNRPNKLFGLQAGGTLQMLKVKGVNNANLIDVAIGDEFDVEWVTISDPELGPQSGNGPFGDFDGSTSSSSGPFLQGWNAGGAQFRRLEGIWEGDGVIYFDDTEGGPIATDTGEREGSVWCYDPKTEKLKVIYTSPAELVLDNPDNITIAPDGSIFLCEDGDRDGLRLQCLSTTGNLSVFGVNDIVIPGSGVPGKPAIEPGDYTGSEWAGATFEPSGEWLFVNIQSPGVTFAITGPWPWLNAERGRRPVNS